MRDLKTAVDLLGLGFAVINTANQKAEDQTLFTVFEIVSRCGKNYLEVHLTRKDLEDLAEAFGKEIQPSEEFTWRDEISIGEMNFYATKKDYDLFKEGK